MFINLEGWTISLASQLSGDEEKDKVLLFSKLTHKAALYDLEQASGAICVGKQSAAPIIMDKDRNNTVSATHKNLTQQVVSADQNKLDHINFFKENISIGEINKSQVFKTMSGDDQIISSKHKYDMTNTKSHLMTKEEEICHDWYKVRISVNLSNDVIKDFRNISERKHVT